MTYTSSRSGSHWISAAVVLLLCATTGATRAQEATPWTHQDYADQSVEFQFAVVSDRAANPREGVFKAALGKLQILRPELVLSVGDFIHGYGDGFKPLTDEALIRKKRDNVDDALKQLPMPFYRVAGNHDYNNDVSARVWKDRYGPAYYAFTYKDVLFLCLNSQDGPNYSAGIGAEQIVWVKETLGKHNDTRWVHLFFHQPLWLEDDKRVKQAEEAGKTPQLTRFGEVERLLEGRDYTVFAGHHHAYGKWIREGQKYFRLATTGGQSALGGPEKKQFDHVLWVTMTADGPVLANLLLDGILDEDAKDNLPVAESE